MGSQESDSDLPDVLCGAPSEGGRMEETRRRLGCSNPGSERLPLELGSLKPVRCREEADCFGLWRTDLSWADAKGTIPFA